MLLKDVIPTLGLVFYIHYTTLFTPYLNLGTYATLVIMT